MNAATSMQDAVRHYVEERRRLGFTLRVEAYALQRFARFADARAHRGPLTAALMLAWAQEHVRRTSSVTAARRLEVVRPFAAYYRQFEPDTEVPTLRVLGRGHRRLTPHIFTDAELVDLLDAAGRLSPSWALRPQTYRAIFGLLAAAGLRLSEARLLTLGDVDLQVGSITVRNGKFHKSRCLPLHQSTVSELQSYRNARDRCHSTEIDSPFFASRNGGYLRREAVEYVFRRLQQQLGWVARGDHPLPRVHDLRHTFVVRRVQRWRETGQSIEHAMFWMCTYLGHARISHTYWYLTGIPELMSAVGDRLEDFVEKGTIGGAR
ncbi:tyrosine-type recombinase/integrase [Paraburkholderia sp. CNPSo 3155]|uniref:Integrase n=1 Tax=Paraburkholderia atlantica TaxID=2654982 RepID=A0A6I1PTT9_PARAM|nr:tyrosine-type recombinase/integrase [Paraburkholderia atlantica]MBB5428779.1 integrase [Paraburkholderia atlantica]MPW08336.1 tyrosine-type recombinase/integrase [Paraburkholderia atlantica]